MSSISTAKMSKSPSSNTHSAMSGSISSSCSDDTTSRSTSNLDTSDSRDAQSPLPSMSMSDADTASLDKPFETGKDPEINEVNVVFVSVLFLL